MVTRSLKTSILILRGYFIKFDLLNDKTARKSLRSFLRLKPIKNGRSGGTRTNGLQYPKPKNMFFEHHCLHIVRIFREITLFCTLFPLFPYSAFPVVISYVVKAILSRFWSKN